MHHEELPNLRAVILAAGLSSRMRGHVKALRPLGDTTMLGAALRAFSRSGVPDVRVVTGHKQSEVAEETLRHNGIPVYNPEYREGMYTSIRAGLAHIEEERRYLESPIRKGEREQLDGLDRPGTPERPASPVENSGTSERPGVDAVFIMPVDAALVRAESIRAMAVAWLSLAPELRKKAVCIPTFGGRYGHPPLFGSDHLLPLIMWQGDGQSQGQRQGRGGLRHYLYTLLSDDAASRFHDARAPQKASLALASCASPLFDVAVTVPHEGSPPSAVFFLSLPDAGIVADMDTPEDLARAGVFLAETRYRCDPAPEEAWEWLRLSGLSAEKISHSIRVALGALRLGLALQDTGLAVSPRLGVCGGLLHDVARKQKDHARAGAELLRREGWHDCATVVSAHTVLPWAMLKALGLAARDMPIGGGDARPEPDATQALRPEVLHACVCVYLSDKFWHGENPVDITERFNRVKGHFADNEEALRAISHREHIARTVADHCAALAGRDAEAVVRTPVVHPLEEWLMGLLTVLKLSP